MMEVAPTYQDVMNCIGRIAQGSRLVRASSVGKSVQGRDIPLVEITDPRAPEENKQLVLVLAGVHGTEEAGRATAIALMEWLASGQPYLTLRNQKIIVLPCVNPDGTVGNASGNAEDADIYDSFGLTGRPTSHEGRLVHQAVGHLNCALAVDIHGLAGGGMNEEFYFHDAFVNSPVNFLAPVLAQEARQAAEAAGFPQREPRRQVRLCLPARLSRECNCFGYTMEITENYYPLHLMTASGLIRLKAILAVGDRQNYYHYYPGYPCEAVSGHAMAWLCAHGKTAAARGQNRRQLLDSIRHIPRLTRIGADAGGAATVKLYADQDLPGLPRFSIQMRIHKPARLKGVSFDGRELSPGEEDGFVVWEDVASKLVRVNVNSPLTSGEHAASVAYDIEW